LSKKNVPRVLIVDDDPEFCKLMEHLLKKFGVHVSASGTPQEFLNRLKSEHFDLCLVDLNMGRDAMGILVLRAVRKVLGPKTPIYIVSGTHGIEHYRQAVEAGATDYILKPLDRKVLATKLSRHFVTQEMMEWLDRPQPPPQNLNENLLTLPFHVVEVIEDSLKVFSPHMISRGSTVTISGKWLKELLAGVEGGVAMRVREVWRNTDEFPNHEGFIHLLEFDSERVELLRSVRLWLMRRKVERILNG
jgi:two-component system chemotaxis response regulator CheY